MGLEGFGLMGFRARIFQLFRLTIGFRVEGLREAEGMGFILIYGASTSFFRDVTLIL